MKPIARQATLKSPAMCGGIALHSGFYVKIALRPAPINTGIVFIRTDITDRDNRVAVRPENVCDVRNCTTLSNVAGVQVGTVEHLMAALAAVGIDNLYIDIDGAELPALDGSSEPFLRLIEQVGISRQDVPRRYIEVLKPIEVTSGQSTARIEPAAKLELDVAIDYDDAAIGYQRVVLSPDTRTFRDSLAKARTFARESEVEALRQAGLGRGGSLENAVVVSGEEILNPEGLRYSDEFVRHKALDLLGDLYIAGPVLGKVTTRRGGHAVNNALLIALFADPEAWRFTSVKASATSLPNEMVTSEPPSVLEEVAI